MCQGKMSSLGVYAACKAGIIALSKTAAKEWGHIPIRCNAVRPGFIATPMLFENTHPDVIKQNMPNCAMDRIGTPQGRNNLLSLSFSVKYVDL